MSTDSPIIKTLRCTVCFRPLRLMHHVEQPPTNTLHTYTCPHCDQRISLMLEGPVHSVEKEQDRK